MKDSVLEKVIRLGGLALQAEDCLIRAAVAQRGLHGGLVRIENERHQQFIVWRAVLSLWDAVLEREAASDLIIQCDDERHYIEMKNWRGASGSSQLPAMRRDIEKLRGREHSYFVVTSMNPQEVTLENFGYLTTQVPGVDVEARQDFRFPTVGLSGQPIEFWIAGWPLERGVSSGTVSSPPVPPL